MNSKTLTQYPQWTGMVAPVVVPFDRQGLIDEAAFREEVRYLMSQPIDGISSGGSTGEGATLSDAELRRCLEIIQEENNRKIPVYAGIIRNSTLEAIRAGRDAKAIGADVLLITPVYYHGATPEGNHQFFTQIANTLAMPTVLYNVVKTNLITPAQFNRMRADSEWMVGVKQVDPLVMADFAADSNNTYLVYGACDSMLYGTYVSGACGAFSALVTIAPGLCQKQWQAYLRGDQEEAIRLQRTMVPIVNSYLTPPYPAKVKALINLQGRSGGLPRPPSLPIDDPQLLQFMKNALVQADSAVLEMQPSLA
jgi:dihydrodipicolinate synthase/N-acetylneuraminate lyase